MRFASAMQREGCALLLDEHRILSPVAIHLDWHPRYSDTIKSLVLLNLTCPGHFVWPFWKSCRWPINLTSNCQGSYLTFEDRLSHIIVESKTGGSRRTWEFFKWQGALPHAIALHHYIHSHPLTECKAWASAASGNWASSSFVSLSTRAFLNFYDVIPKIQWYLEGFLWANFGTLISHSIRSVRNPKTLMRHIELVQTLGDQFQRPRFLRKLKDRQSSTILLAAWFWGDHRMGITT